MATLSLNGVSLGEIKSISFDKDDSPIDVTEHGVPGMTKNQRAQLDYLLTFDEGFTENEGYFLEWLDQHARGMQLDFRRANKLAEIYQRHGQRRISDGEIETNPGASSRVHGTVGAERGPIPEGTTETHDGVKHDAGDQDDDSPSSEAAGMHKRKPLGGLDAGGSAWVGT